MDNDLTLKQATLKLGFVSEAEFWSHRRPGKNGKALCCDRCCELPSRIEPLTTLQLRFSCRYPAGAANVDLADIDPKGW